MKKKDVECEVTWNKLLCSTELEMGVVVERCWSWKYRFRSLLHRNAL